MNGDKNRIRAIRSHIQAEACNLSGLEDASGVELASLVRMVANLYETVIAQGEGQVDLSGPRWGLMMRLLGEERHGVQGGVTPTYLSRCQNVSKNTISSLLRGLEEQGLVQRTLDAQDHRIFRIHLTDAGRNLVLSTAPQRVRFLNNLGADLSTAERQELAELLSKLYDSIMENSGVDEAQVARDTAFHHNGG